VFPGREHLIWYTFRIAVERVERRSHAALIEYISSHEPHLPLITAVIRHTATLPVHLIKCGSL
jgi:hypothetical protein